MCEAIRFFAPHKRRSLFYRVQTSKCEWRHNLIGEKSVVINFRCSGSSLQADDDSSAARYPWLLLNAKLFHLMSREKHRNEVMVTLVMGCHAMSLTTVPPHHCRLHNVSSQRLSFVQVRLDCHLMRAGFLNNGRNGTFGIATSKSLIPWSAHSSSVETEPEDDDEGDAWLVDESTSPHNHITVLELDESSSHELAGAFVLKLDSADLAHSVFWRDGRVWSGGCHDVFASLPPLLPEGPIGILGLGAGTVARLLLSLWPHLRLQGWELDAEVIRVAREYFQLADLEKTSHLVVHIGDALGAQAKVRGGFAGIMVDIFIHGTMCRDLARASTWRKLRKRLRAGGRVMVNCIPNANHLREGSEVSREWDVLMYGIVRAMEAVFPGEVCVRELTDGNNVMLLSGGVVDGDEWAGKVPEQLKEGVREWRVWDEHHPRYREP